MRIVVVTSCTGEKAASPAYPLTLEEFEEGGARLARRQAELAAYQRPAAALYTGQQHVRLMRGVQTFRDVLATASVPPKLELWILSAGYGLVPEGRLLVP
jgi:hypothetical protein